MIKASEIIKNSCCGNMLDVPKCELVKQVKILEDEKHLLEIQLSNALTEIKRLSNGRG